MVSTAMANVFRNNYIIEKRGAEAMVFYKDTKEAYENGLAPASRIGGGYSF